MGYYSRNNVWYDDCCKGKYAFDEESTGDAGRNLCDVCDQPLPSKDIPIGAPRNTKPVKDAAVKVKKKKAPDKTEKESTKKES